MAFDSVAGERRGSRRASGASAFAAGGWSGCLDVGASFSRAQPVLLPTSSLAVVHVKAFSGSARGEGRGTKPSRSGGTYGPGSCGSDPGFFPLACLGEVGRKAAAA